MKIFKALINLVIVLLFLILILNNMQKVEFNLDGIYVWHIPLIAILLIVLIIGMIIGFTLKLIRLAELKIENHSLKKQLQHLQQNNRL